MSRPPAGPPHLTCGVAPFHYIEVKHEDFVQLALLVLPSKQHNPVPGDERGGVPSSPLGQGPSSGHGAVLVFPHHRVHVQHIYIVDKLGVPPPNEHEVAHVDQRGSVHAARKRNLPAHLLDVSPDVHYLVLGRVVLPSARRGDHLVATFLRRRHRPQVNHVHLPLHSPCVESAIGKKPGAVLARLLGLQVHVRLNQHGGVVRHRQRFRIRVSQHPLS
mmetsp:Transcript_9579/g.13010  ORF Transcript_9579/g.13010 Transcript_9579/m.13010 type:complete len:217 (-) Transcript_9579:329-979(-)